jgi:hypothetical protein
MKSREPKGKPIDVSKVEEFEKTETQLKGFYDEISLLSKKKPDDPVNKFKLKLINQVLASSNALLGEVYRPFPDFQLFEEDNLPTASDVVVMLAQYLGSMDRFRRDHTFYDSLEFSLIWATTGKEKVKAREPKEKKH